MVQSIEPSAVLNQPPLIGLFSQFQPAPQPKSFSRVSYALDAIRGFGGSGGRIPMVRLKASQRPQDRPSVDSWRPDT